MKDEDIDQATIAKFLDEFGIVKNSIGSKAMFAFLLKSGCIVTVYPQGHWRVTIGRQKLGLSGIGIDSLKQCVTKISY